MDDSGVLSIINGVTGRNQPSTAVLPAVLSQAAQSGTTPDQEAQWQRLARESNVPVGLIRNGAPVKLMQLQQQANTIPAVAPATAQFLSNPDNAAIAHDQVPELSYIEEFIKKPLSSVGSTIGQAIGLASMPIAKALDYMSGDTEQTDALIKQMQEYHQYSKDAAPSPQLGTAGHVGRAVAEIAPYLVMGPAGVAAMTAGATADKLQSNMDAGIDDGTNWISSWGTGLAAYGMTQLPFGAKTKLGSIARGAALNTGFGVASRAMDSAILSRGGYDDLAAQASPFDTNSMIHDAVMGSLFGAHAAYDIYAREVADRAEAQQARDFITQLGSEVTDNKVTKRFEPAMQEFLRLAKQDGPVQDVYMPVQEWNTLWQDSKETPDEAAQRVLGSDDAYHESLVLGNDMKIPLETFLTEFGKRPDFADLAGRIKIRPDSMTADDAMGRGDLDAGRMAELDRLVKEQDTGNTAGSAAQETTPGLKVYNDIYGQIAGLGRYDRKTAEDNAKIATAHVLRLADDFGQDPWQFWQNDDLSGRVSFTNRVDRVASRQKIDMATDPFLDALRAGSARDQMQAGNQPEGLGNKESYFTGKIYEYDESKWATAYDAPTAKGEYLVKLGTGVIRPANWNGKTWRNSATDSGRGTSLDRLVRGWQPVDKFRASDAVGDQKNTDIQKAQAQVDQMVQTKRDQMRQMLDAHGIDLKSMGNEDVRKALKSSEYSQNLSDQEMADKFVKSPSGSFDFGNLPEMADGKGTVYPAAPVRLEKGSDYGHSHISEKRIQEFKDYGYSDEKAALHDIISNFTDIYTQNNGRLLIVKRDKRGKYASVELQLDGGYYGVTTWFLEDAKPKSKTPYEKRGGRDLLLHVAHADDSGQPSPFPATDSNDQAGSSRRSDQSNHDITIPPSDINVKNQGDNIKRGFFRTSPHSPLREIGILKDANATTFVHEVGHWALDDLQRLAARDDAPQQIRDDWETVRKWLKAGDDGQLADSQHEKFADGMITFFREGKAPSEGLRGAFERLSTWINGIFQRLQASGVKLNDDVREVMERMFATDNEIARAKEQVDQKPLFASAEAMGKPEKEFEAYRRVGTEAAEAAREKLRAESLKEFRRQHLEWWKEEKGKISDQITREAQDEPVYRAIQELSKGKDFEGKWVDPMKIDRQLLVDRYGEDFVKRLPRGVVAKDGVHPDIAVERFGFDSADAMIRQMADAPNIKEYVAREADARMNDQHGAMHLDGSIVDKATEAVNNDKWAQVLWAEIKALRAKADEARAEVNGLKRDGRVEAALRRHADEKIPTFREMKETAYRQIGEQDAKEINPAQYLHGERKTAREAFRLYGEGKYDLAADARTRHLLNQFMFLEATNAKAEVKKIGQYIQAIAARRLGNIGKADPEMLGQVQGILERFGVLPPDNAAVRQPFSIWLQGFEERAGTPLPIDAGFIENPGRPLDRLTMNELRSVRDTLKMIETAARDMNKVRINGEMVDRIAMAGKMAGSVYRAVKERKGADTRAGQGLFEKVADYPLDLVLKRREFIFRRLDNYKDIGPWHDAMMNSYNDASEHQLRLMEKVYPDILNIIRGGGFDGLQDRYGRPITHRIDAIGASLAKNDIIAIALNSGNESNMAKLMRSGLKLEGRDMPVELDPDQLQAILSHLTPKDIASVNTIWKAIERLKPDAAALAQRRLGVEPRWIEAQPLQVANGTLEGGYFPIKYDARWSQAGKLMDDATTINDLFTYRGAHTNQGYMKARDERAAYPLDLNWSGIVTRHLNDVILDISHWQFARDARRLLNDGQVNQALQERLGKEYANNLRGWVDQTIQAERFSPDVEGFVGNLNQLYRRNMSTFALGFRMFNALAEVGTQAVTAFKECSASAVRDAVLSYGRNPLTAVRFAESTSPFLKNLSQEIDRDFSSALRDIAGKHSVLDDVKKWGLMAKMVFYRQSAALGWLSGFQEGQKRGYTDDQARRFADSVVRMTQVSGRAGDLSAIEGQSNQWVRSLTQFIGPSLVAYNHLSEAATMIKDKGVTKDTVMNALADAVFIGLSQAVLFNVIRGKYPDNLDDVPKWLLARLMFGRMDGIPVMRDMAGLAESHITGEHYSVRPMPIYSGLESVVDVGKAMAKGDFDEVKLGKKVATAVGMATGLPTLQATVTGEFFHDLIDGSYEPKHPWSPVTDVLNYHKKGK